MVERNTDPDFDLERFLPYMLNQAAEATSRSFQAVYRNLYGMTRTQWRVMANLGKFGAMTAKDICVISHVEKTKVSRAVSALESEGFLLRTPSEDDRRAEILSLTEKGQTAFRDLGHRANEYDEKLRAELGDRVSSELIRSLQFLMKL
ncbi:MarR family winged helix-turn-helix transcriptional regulator [Sinorhizobium alkalisoli]|uniref:MarR family winged helix-turn-helix transcriptional regulator n=1 Tax=Sinorhizobium alkalisoli TaxID=1752398 RepID=UPI00124E2395|nr:MarR family transcriptional regulator [Sinorhizobium alkalisoli]QFI68881.1 Transcriptional regulator, MarR family [Sinorhizobium alkalisoli]